MLCVGVFVHIAQILGFLRTTLVRFSGILWG